MLKNPFIVLKLRVWQALSDLCRDFWGQQVLCGFSITFVSIKYTYSIAPNYQIIGLFVNLFILQYLDKMVSPDQSLQCRHFRGRLSGGDLVTHRYTQDKSTMNYHLLSFNHVQLIDYESIQLLLIMINVCLHTIMKLR